ncbi:MAG: hypothetical protein IT437_04850, partial [Phycisphaerales bacterium]|nr:hypothetical protein [Phycisphaerales bacterium]
MSTRLSILAVAACASVATAQACRPYWVRTLGDTPGGTLTLSLTPDSSRLVAAGGYGIGGVAYPAIFWDRGGLVLPGPGLELGIQGVGSVFDDGTGPSIYVRHSTRSPATPFAIDRYTGRAWVPANPSFYGRTDWFAAPRPVFTGEVDGMQVVFGIVPASDAHPSTTKAALWTGTRWEVIGDPSAALYGPTVMFMFDDGNGPRVHSLAREPAWGIGAVFARLDDWQWTPLPPAGGRCAKVYDGGGRAYAYVGLDAGGKYSSPLIRWDGRAWSEVPGIGVSTGGAWSVSALEVFDDGSGPMLYVAGLFGSAGGQPAGNIAKWDGTQWHTLPVGIGGWVDCMAVYDDGRGESLFLGGAEGLRVPGLPSGPLLQLVGCRGQCYPDCNNDDALTLADFGCFQTMYATKNPYADCDGNGALTLSDFACFAP